MPPQMRFRFRKSLTLWPGHLKATVSRRGVSLNGRVGIFSRSWGTRGRSTTIDMPGTSGIFWRREDRRRKLRGADAMETAFLRREQAQRRWARAGTVVCALACVVLAGRAYLVPLARGCDNQGTGIRLLILLGLVIGAYAGLRALWPALRGPGSLLAAAGAGALGWWLYGLLVAGSVVCS